MDNSSIGNRMKNYEAVSDIRLVNRMPIILRIDGRAFHTFTRGLKKPFDEVFVKTMQETMQKLCENIDSCVLGYTQSDEISLLLVNYDILERTPWFDNRIQKICSIASSIAVYWFVRQFRENAAPYLDGEDGKYSDILKKKIDTPVQFDCRAFNIPKEDVTNNFYWRQLDASRNSILSVGYANFSTEELHGKNCNEVQDMLHEQRGINWNDLPTHLRRGSCCKKVTKSINGVERHIWEIDKEIPTFKGDGREYIEKLI